MALLDQVFTLCRKKLVGKGWDRLLKEGHGLDIGKASAKALAQELARPGLAVNRKLSGFEDFAGDGDKGVEPGSPARSLLYHALASPNVLNGIDGQRLGYFPTPAELEAVENYVFAAGAPDLATVRARAGAAAGEPLRVVVFAHEYRPAGQTCHGLHADMVYARTGVARVGTAAPRYRADLRGYMPESDADPFTIHALPARFAAYLAVKRKGRAAEARPMRFRPRRRPGDPPDWVSDDQRDFWVPVHKLFPGDECLNGVPIAGVTFDARLVNDKLLRIHTVGLKTNPPPQAVPPFRITAGIASISADPADAAGTLAPDPHPLVEKARAANGKLVTFRVPGGEDGKAFDTLSVGFVAPPLVPPDDPGEFRKAPAYVHVRTAVANGQEEDLNGLDDQALTARIEGQGFDALHYVDFTGDGWVAATVDGPALAGQANVTATALPAYALVTAPDFFPSCDQRQLTAWGENSVPQSIRNAVWNVPPDTLADQRLAANLQIDKHPFDPSDFTMTCVVSLAGAAASGALPTGTPDALRHSHLPDDAAGVFAPGWDISRDWTRVPANGGKVVWHLAAYGLGSPFPEDAKLCAALSTFWPAVAPDATRQMNEAPNANLSGTVAPLTDEEVGQIGDLPWDGVRGPRVVTVGGKSFAEFASFRHVDYVRNALDGLFTMRLLARVDAKEYQRRVLAAAFAYLALGFERTTKVIKPATLRRERAQWTMLSFRRVLQGDPELEKAKVDAKVLLPDRVYRMEFFPSPDDLPVLDVVGDNRNKRMEIRERQLLFVDPVSREAAVRERAQSTWHKGQFVV